MDRRDEEVVSGGPARTFHLSWQEAKVPLRRAAAALWGPAVLPFLFGPLTECAHCVRSYLAIVPVLPGFLAAAWVRHEVVAFYALGLVATLAVLGLTALLIGLAGRRWPWVAIGFGVLFGAQAIGLGHVLRT